jgi:predicted 2-oxoglutarate/Fe(II)-dependent dioxygenase YbiX
MKKVETKRNGIYRFDDVLSEKTCKQIVDYISNDLSKMPWEERDNIRWDKIDNDELYNKILEYRKTAAKLVSDSFGECVYPHFTDIVLWRAGRFMNEHIDDGSNIHFNDKNNLVLKEDLRYRIYTSVLYLNDDFKGGQTFVNSINGQYISEPKTGTIIFFKSSAENPHGVFKVESGVRVTMPMWFTRELNQSEIYNVR